MIAYRYFLLPTINSVHTALITGILLTASTDTEAAKRGWFSGYKKSSYKYEAPEQLFELRPNKKSCSLCIEHQLPGTIDLQGWHQSHVAVTVRKYTHTAEDAARITTLFTQTEHGIINLKTEESEDVRKAARVDITVHVPHHRATTITTHNDVSIENTDSLMRVVTQSGDITTHGTRGALHLETKKGNLLAVNSYGPIAAYTNRGTITIEESYNSIKAETSNGSIDVVCAEVPSTACIDLRTQKRGIINLSVPESTEAQLIADTTRGIITSDVLVTRDRQTTVLNSGTYQDLQRHIRGTVGEQATAEIRLNSTKGIHITASDIA